MELKKENKIPIIMIVGVGHSGSTLLDLIMDSHSQIVGVGELSHFRKFFLAGVFCSCRKELSNCRFWQRVFGGIDYSVLRLIYRYKFDFLLNRKRYFYFDRKENKLDLDQYIRTMEQVYRNILIYSKKKVVVDSSKSPDRAELLLLGKKFNIILLHLVRDGRGVAYSNIKLGRPSFKYMKEWMVGNIKTEIIKLRNRNVKSIFIKYEDFAKKPERVLKYILKQIDLTFEPEMLNFRNKIHHQAGGNYKLRILSNDDKIKLDEQWKKKMSLVDKVVFNIFFGWLNLFYKLKIKKYDR